MLHILKSDLFWQLTGGFVAGVAAMLVANPEAAARIAGQIGALVHLIG